MRHQSDDTDLMDYKRCIKCAAILMISDSSSRQFYCPSEHCERYGLITEVYTSWKREGKDKDTMERIYGEKF